MSSNSQVSEALLFEELDKIKTAQLNDKIYRNFDKCSAWQTYHEESDRLNITTLSTLYFPTEEQIE